MAQAKATVREVPVTTIREVPIITKWVEAVDAETTNYAKGTKIVVAKANKTTHTPKPGAQPLFKYQNRYGVIGDWYAKADLVIVDKPKNGKVKVTKQAEFTPEQLKKIRSLKAQGLL